MGDSDPEEAVLRYICILISDPKVSVYKPFVSQILNSLLFDAGMNMTEILIRVTSGKRPNVEMVPDDKPPECEEMISIMQACWCQDSSERPAFSGNTRLCLFFYVHSEGLQSIKKKVLLNSSMFCFDSKFSEVSNKI